MKRDEIKSIIEGITDEQLDAIMKLNGTDITALNAKIKGLEDNAKKFEGVDVEALKKQISDLTAEKAAIIYNGKLERAIEKAGGRSVKAIRALLDEEPLKDSKDLDADLEAAITKAKEENSWAFEDVSGAPEKEPEKEPETTTARVSTGGEHGTGGTADDAVTAAFKQLNPGLKL